MRVADAVLLVVVVSVAPGALSAQETIVGLVGGAVRTTQIWSPATPNERHTGLTLGAFADVPMGSGWLSVRAEGSYTQRGGDAVLDVGGVPSPGRLRMDLLTVALHLKAAVHVGPAGVYGVVGPTLDQVLRRRLDPVLSQVFDEETTQIIGVGMGVGVEADIRGTLHVGAELRFTEGLSPAYDGAFTTVRNRSMEVLLRVGVPLSVVRGS